MQVQTNFTANAMGSLIFQQESNNSTINGWKGDGKSHLNMNMFD